MQETINSVIAQALTTASVARIGITRCFSGPTITTILSEAHTISLYSAYIFFFSPKLNKLSDREQQFAIFLSFFKILFLFFTFGNSFYSCPVLFLKQISFLILA